MDFSKLKSREKTVFLALAGVLFFGIYWRAVQEPVAKKTAAYRTQIKKSQAQLKDLMSKEPQDKEVAEKIDSLSEDNARLSEQIGTLEKKIPSRFNMSKLVGEFTRLANDVKLDSVKQRITKDQGYSRIFLEVKFYSTYLNAIKYVAAVESISPFLRVEEMEILEPKGKTIELGGSPVRLLVSCLLSDNPEGGPLVAVEGTGNATSQRDILVSSARPAAALEDANFQLEGITFDPKNPTAIINGDVFMTNAKVAGFTIKKILSDGVVLSDGVQDHLLKLKGNETELKKP